MDTHPNVKRRTELEMPTYLVSAAAGRLDAAAKQQIAFGITQSHTTATGAPGFFAQVIFNDVPAGNHFIGGKLLRSDQIFVHGYIRAGRTADQKQQLFNDIVRVVQEGAKVAVSLRSAAPRERSILRGSCIALSRSALYAFGLHGDGGTLFLRRAFGNLNAPFCSEGFRASGSFGSPCWIYPSFDLAKGER